MNALILFSHGSLLCGSGEALQVHTARLRATGEWDDVSFGYLNYSQPLFAEAARDAIGRGATRIFVAPYFLVPGYFVSKALPEALAPVRAAYPNVEFVVGNALGTDDALADALWEAATATAQSSDRWDDPLLRAARACRPSPDCPLYATSACPKVAAPINPVKEETHA